MQSVVVLLRVLFVSVAAVAAFLAENPVKAHVIPRSPIAKPAFKLPPPPTDKSDILDWTGPTRQATIWR